MNIIVALLTILLCLILIIAIWIVFEYLVKRVAHGQVAYAQTNNVTPALTPMPTTAPTPTTPAPQFQYLPQKSYVQTFAPEQGVPSPTGSTTNYQALPPPQQAQSSGGLGGFDISTIMSLASLGGAVYAGRKAHVADSKAKDVMGSDVQNKDTMKELARVMYEMNSEKANQINDAPAIKLETLSKNATEAATKAAKS